MKLGNVGGKKMSSEQRMEQTYDEHQIQVLRQRR